MKSPKIPEPQAQAAAHTVADPAVQEAQAEAIRRKTNKRGFRSTILRNRMMDPNSPVVSQPGTQETMSS